MPHWMTSFDGLGATLRLQLYNPHSGKREKTIAIRHDTLQRAFESAVIDGYLSDRDFHVVADDGRDDSPLLWNGFQHQRDKVLTSDGKLRASAVEKIEAQIKRYGL